MLALAATAALVLSMAAPAAAAPAAAAPERSPWAFNATVKCGDQSWDVVTTGKIGWLAEGPAGPPVGVLLGGIRTATVGGQASTLVFAPPPGLADKWVVCTIVRDLGDGDSATWDPAYILLTPASS